MTDFCCTTTGCIYSWKYTNTSSEERTVSYCNCLLPLCCSLCVPFCLGIQTIVISVHMCLMDWKFYIDETSCCYDFCECFFCECCSLGCCGCCTIMDSCCCCCYEKKTDLNILGCECKCKEKCRCSTIVGGNKYSLCGKEPLEFE